MNYKEILLLSIIIIGSLIASQFSKMEGFQEGATDQTKAELEEKLQQIHKLKNNFDEDWEKLKNKDNAKDNKAKDNKK